MCTNVQDVTCAGDVPSQDPLGRALNHDMSNLDAISGVCSDVKNDRPDNATVRISMLTDSELPIIAPIEF